MVAAMINKRFQLGRLGVNAVLYIRDGIPELEDGAPFWLYNDLRHLLHEANKQNNDGGVEGLLAKITAHGYIVTKLKLLKEPKPTARWLGRKKVVQKHGD